MKATCVSVTRHEPCCTNGDGEGAAMGGRACSVAILNNFLVDESKILICRELNAVFASMSSRGRQEETEADEAERNQEGAGDHKKQKENRKETGEISEEWDGNCERRRSNGSSRNRRWREAEIKREKAEERR